MQQKLYTDAIPYLPVALITPEALHCVASKKKASRNMENDLKTISVTSVLSSEEYIRMSGLRAMYMRRMTVSDTMDVTTAIILQLAIASYGLFAPREFPIVVAVASDSPNEICMTI